MQENIDAQTTLETTPAASTGAPNPGPAPAGTPPEAPAGTTATPEATPPPADSANANPHSAIEQAAAAELARVYRAMPGVVAELIGGQTIADVQATFAAAQRVYADVRAAVLRDLGAALPAGHAAPGAPPAPADPFGLIAAGLRK